MTYVQCLTKSELEDITGFKAKRCQMRELAFMKIPYTTNTCGDIKVDRETYRATVVGLPEPKKTRTRPNFEALEA